MSERIIVLSTAQHLTHNREDLYYLTNHEILIDDVMELATRAINHKLCGWSSIQDLSFTPLEIDRVVAEVSMLIHRRMAHVSNAIPRGSRATLVNVCHRVVVRLIDMLITCALQGPLKNLISSAKCILYRGHQGWDIEIGVIDEGISVNTDQARDMQLYRQRFTAVQW